MNPVKSTPFKVLKKMAILGLVSILAFSCGKSDKGGDENQGVTNQFQFLNQGQINQVSQLYQQMPCQAGRMPEIHLGLQGGASGNTISGTLFGQSVGGSPAATWIGANTQMGAVMIVTQMINGQQSGFNVTLSFCREVNPYNPQDYIIHENFVNAGSTQFSLPYAVLGQQVSCASGPVQYGSVVFGVQGLGNVQYDFAPAQVSCQ